MDLPAGVVNTFTLDGEGKRRRLEDSAGLRNLLWEGENILVETDSNQVTVARYTLAPQLYGDLVSQRRAGASFFHHFDALGSTSYLTDASQNPLAAYLYRAFGQQTILSGSSANPLTFVGRVGYCRQPDGQDYWVRARVHRPSPGRWLSRDPFCQGLTYYTYALNNPAGYRDPTGCYLTFADCTPKERTRLGQAAKAIVAEVVRGCLTTDEIDVRNRVFAYVSETKGDATSEEFHVHCGGQRCESLNSSFNRWSKLPFCRRQVLLGYTPGTRSESFEAWMCHEAFDKYGNKDYLAPALLHEILHAIGKKSESEVLAIAKKCFPNCPFDTSGGKIVILG